MSTNKTARDSSEEDTIADVTSMHDEALKDPAVAHRLGRAYLTRIETLIAHTTETIIDKSAALQAQLEEHDHVAEDAGHLVLVLKDIRDSVAIDEQPVTVQKAFGRGANWDATQPAKLETAGKHMAKAIHDHPDVVRSAGIDAQHRHDLVHYTEALAESRKHHRDFVANRKDAVAARKLALAKLRAASHHIRLVARLMHRREPEKLAHFVSPVAHHRVVHHAPKTPAK